MEFTFIFMAYYVQIVNNTRVLGSSIVVYDTVIKMNRKRIIIWIFIQL